MMVMFGMTFRRSSRGRGPQPDVIAQGCGMRSKSGNILLVPDGRPAGMFGRSTPVREH